MAVRLLITLLMFFSVILVYIYTCSMTTHNCRVQQEIIYNFKVFNNKYFPVCLHVGSVCLYTSMSHIFKNNIASTGNGPAILKWWGCKVIYGYTEACHYHIWWSIEASCACDTVDFSLIPLEDPSHPFISPLRVTEPSSWNVYKGAIQEHFHGIVLVNNCLVGVVFEVFLWFYQYFYCLFIV